MQTRMNDDDHHALMNTSYCITLHPGLVHMFEIMKNTYGMSLKSRRFSWMSNGDKVRLYISKTSARINKPLIGGQKHWNFIGECYVSLG